MQPYFRYKELNNKYRLLPGSKKYGSYTRIVKPYNVRDVVDNNFNKIEKERKAFKDRIYKAEEEKELTRSRRKRLRIQYRALKKKKADLIRRNLNNIEELKRTKIQKRYIFNSTLKIYGSEVFGLDFIEFNYLVIKMSDS